MAKKRYDEQPEEEPMMVNDSDIQYDRKLSDDSPCIFTPQEKAAQIERGLREKKLGGGTPHEEMKKRFR